MLVSEYCSRASKKSYVHLSGYVKQLPTRTFRLCPTTPRSQAYRHDCPFVTRPACSFEMNASHFPTATEGLPGHQSSNCSSCIQLFKRNEAKKRHY